LTGFKLKQGVRFTPQDQAYIVFDQGTRSTFRVGQHEYMILKQLWEPTNIEEIRFRLQSELGIEIPYSQLNGFIEKAMGLGIVEAAGASVWRRMSRTGQFALRVKFHDPTQLFDKIIPTFQRWGRAWLVLGFALLLTAITINVIHFGELWSLRSLRIPPYGPMIALLIFVASYGHEMTHGLIARWYGFDVPEVGFHVHYGLPSFYCKILTRGSFFDLIVLSTLLLIWFLGDGAGSLREMIAFAVSLIWVKVLLIQLNPFLPLSDGYRIAGLLISRKRR
jgi:hypothetical protein